MGDGGESASGAPGLSIGVIVPDLSGSGGAERLALRCVRAWRERHRVTLYSMGFDATLLAEFGVEDVPRHRLAGRLGRDPAPGGDARLVETLVASRIWEREVGEHDVYVGHQWRTRRFRRAPFVWYAHETNRPAYDLRRERASEVVANEMRYLLDPWDPVRPDLRDEIHQAALRELDAGPAPERVVANSRFTAAEIERHLGLASDAVVYPGVDPEDFLEPVFEEPLFLSVGSLLQHKRHRLAIEAVSLVAGARLVVAGRGRNADGLRRMASRLGVADRVEVREDVGPAELRALYAACRAVVFTPLREPFGMVALEALAAGKPLVAVDEGGFTEVVDASCALLVPPEPARLAEALSTLLARPEDAERMGHAGRKLARSFGWDRTAAGLEAVLVDAAREHRARRAAPTPRRTAAHPAPPGPALGVRLVCDYGEGAAEGAWRRPGAADAMPRAGFYASHQETTLRRQLAEIEACGFDLALLSLRLDDLQLSPFGAVAVRHALQIAAESEGTLRFAVELVLARPTAKLLTRALDWLAGLARGRSDWLAVDGRPLLVVADATAQDDLDHPAWCVRHRPAAGATPTTGGLRWVPVGRDADPGEALAGALDGPPVAAVVVASWNDHAAGEVLEPTVRDDGARAEAARAALARLRTAPARLRAAPTRPRAGHPGR